MGEVEREGHSGQPHQDQSHELSVGAAQTIHGTAGNKLQNQGPRVTEQATAIKTRKARYDVQGWLRSFKESDPTGVTCRKMGNYINSQCIQNTSKCPIIL